MLHVDKLLDQLGEGEYVTTLDLTKGYWKISLMPESQNPHHRLCHPFSLYNFQTVPFGLHGVPTFQQLMD